MFQCLFENIQILEGIGYHYLCDPAQVTQILSTLVSSPIKWG